MRYKRILMTFSILLPLLFLYTLRSFALSAVPLHNGVNHLDDIGVYNVTYQYYGGSSGKMPVGWVSYFDDTTGVACMPFGIQNGKQAFLLHPPWRNGTGVSNQIFDLRLPKAKNVYFRFAVALSDEAAQPGKSDGVGFHVYLNNKQIMYRLKKDAKWTDYQFDLTPYAGQTIELRFETDPGPKRDPSFDFALWGDREIVVNGSGKFTPHLKWNESAVTVRFSPHPSDLLQGITMKSAGERIDVGLGSAIDFNALQSSKDSNLRKTIVQYPETTKNEVKRVAKYVVNGKPVNVTATLKFIPPYTIRAIIHSDSHHISAVHFGTFGPLDYRKTISVPYYGNVIYMPDKMLFANTYIDYTVSQASDLNGYTAEYLPLTSGIRNPVYEVGDFLVSPILKDVLPAPPNPPSPYRKLLSNKVILDTWGGNFKENGEWLNTLASYHLTHFATIVHVWQNGGYDNKLPNTLPANADLGGNAGLRSWISTAEKLGELIGVHENYVDFYPNEALYDVNNVARDSNGNLIPAWKNLIQSYAMAPTEILHYARMITPQVQKELHPNMSYLDVHSAVPPWFHVDFRANVPGAGKFHTVLEAHKNLWKLFREVHHGPVLGEGANHWYWSGLLDGVEAQFGVGWPANQGQTAPLFVNFDLDRIHPLQFNHGMGYIERWLASGYTGDWQHRVPDAKTLDQYRMQEIAYGHAGFVAGQFYKNLPFVWEEHNLLWPITSQYATAKASLILYDVHGRMLPIEQAIAADDPLNRVYVQYNDGLRVWANGAKQHWNVGAELPQYGWEVKGKNLFAATAIRDGVVSDYLETPNMIFANSRTDMQTRPHIWEATPYVPSFHQTGPRQFDITYAWRTKDKLPQGYVIFIHLTNPQDSANEGIVLQTSSGIASSPSQWSLGDMVGSPVSVTLPDTLKDGSYILYTGMYNPEPDGNRLNLTGLNDGNNRYMIGTLTVSNNGADIGFKPVPLEESIKEGTLPPERHVNLKGILVDFGKVATDGSILMNKDKTGYWLIIPFPRTRQFTIRLKEKDFNISTATPALEALNSDYKVVKTVPVERTNGWLQFTANTIPSAIYYRIK